MFITQENRETGKNMLNTVLNSIKNINILEKNVFKISSNNSSIYFDYIYEIVGDIINKLTLNDILKNIKKKHIGWNHPVFTHISLKICEQNNFYIKPFEVAEGIVQCNKCGSKRTYSYHRQTRGADEPMSTFSTCMKCKNSWVYSG